LLTGRTTFQRIFRPANAGWFAAPAEEAEYVTRNLGDRRIGCDADVGNYLIWRLGAVKRVMFFGRPISFDVSPAELSSFLVGRDVEGYVRKSDVQVWVLGLRHYKTIEWFIRNPDWKLAFYDLNAVVLVRKDLEIPQLPPSGPGLGQVKTYAQGRQVFRIIDLINDASARDTVLAAVRKIPLSQEQSRALAGARMIPEEE
jgi:hypothetical protein